MSYFNNDAETAVLSILLKSPDKIFESHLKSNLFSSLPNKALFSEIESLYKQGLTPEYSLLLNSLINNKKIDIIGGKDYLDYLYNQAYDQTNLSEFEKLLINSYKARSLLSMSTRIPELVSDESSVDQVIEYVKNSVETIAFQSGNGEVLSIEDVGKLAWNKIVDMTKSDDKISNSTSLANLDAVTGGYVSGDLWVVAGRPGMGKSSFLCNSILSGVPSLIFSLEMSKELIVYRLLAIKTGIPIFNIRFGILTQAQLNLISDALKEIKNLPIYIDTNFFADINYVNATIRKYQKIHDIKVVHVDYIQLLAERSNEAVHELGRITRDLKRLANSLGITVVIYSQLNRSVESRDDKRPMLSDLRQSGNIEEDVDVAIFLYRDVLYSPDTKDKSLLELLIRKQRSGPVGMVASQFFDDTNRIIEK